MYRTRLIMSKLKRERKEALVDLITSIIGLTIIAILVFITTFQTARISDLEDENFKLFAEVQDLKEVIDSEYRERIN